MLDIMTNNEWIVTTWVFFGIGTLFAWIAYDRFDVGEGKVVLGVFIYLIAYFVIKAHLQQ